MGAASHNKDTGTFIYLCHAESNEINVHTCIYIYIRMLCVSIEG